MKTEMQEVSRTKSIPEAIRIHNGRHKHLARLRQLQAERRRLVALVSSEAVHSGKPAG